MSVALQSGSRVGAYVLGERIGAGASGVVFDAKSDDGSRVALKVLRDDVAIDSESRARMEREAKVLSSLEHPAIVRVCAVGALDDGRPWIAMDRVEGPSLRRSIDEGTYRGDPRAAWSLVRPVCEAVALAHARGVIHRDIKPDNILRDAGGRALLADFGLARASVGSPLEHSTITGPGAALGTPPYMAPELWWNASVTDRVDQYAIACVLYELVCGRTPFRAQSFGAWMEAHLHDSVPAVASAIADSERAVAIDAFFARALAKEASDRFESMGALILCADQAFGVEPRSIARQAERGRPWLAALWVTIGAGALAIIGHGGTRSIGELWKIAGWGIIPTAASVAAALVLALLGRSSRVAGVVAAAFGLFGAATGWRQVLRTIAAAPAESRFSILHEGLYEADVNRALGYWGAWGACCASLALGPSAAISRASRMVIAVSSLVAATLAAAGAYRAALVLALTIVSVALFSRRTHATRDEVIDRGASAAAACLAAMGASAVSLGAADAAVWRAHIDRAERVARLTALSREATLLGFASLCALVAVLAVVASALRDKRWRARPIGALRSVAPFVAALAILSIADATLRVLVHGARSAAREAIAGPFSLFSRLEVPSARGLPEPHVGPSVQLAEDVVAIDGRATVRVAALATAVGRATLASDLSHRFALERQSSASGGPRWTLAVDRRSPWSRVRLVLEIARDAGGGEPELLFARSANPRWSVWAPPESSLVVPGDYGALELCVRAGGDALSIDDGAVFSVASARLLSSRVAGRCVAVASSSR